MHKLSLASFGALENMERRVAIVGAGLSGLIACKYILLKGYKPIVFESRSHLGGVWLKTIETTKLQTEKFSYQFTDFPWPESVAKSCPDHDQVLGYMESYAQHFGLIGHITFDAKVVSIEYEGVDDEEMKAWSMWGGTGEAFHDTGKWKLMVENTRSRSSEDLHVLHVYRVDFVILALGRFSDIPNVPEFLPDKGPEVFQGEVIHSMDYAAMDYDKAKTFIKGKRVIVVGFKKFALDIAAECAAVNGEEMACTILYRTEHWFMPESKAWGFLVSHLFFNRFAELLVQKPGRGSLLNLLSTALSPLSWSFSKLAECYLKWKTPLKKYGIVPKHSFSEGLSSRTVCKAPEGFFNRVDEGSIVLKKADEFCFCKDGILVNGKSETVEADVVIFATGYKGERKIRGIFVSQTFQKLVAGSPSAIVPLYRGCIHPRIPQLAIIGLSTSPSLLFLSEMMSGWVSELLYGTFRLPIIAETEKDIKECDEYMKRRTGRHYGRSCLPAVHLWYNDQLCKDMGLNPRRKRGFLAELFEPYSPSDYTLS